MRPPVNDRYEFGGYTLDTRERTLFCRDRKVPLRPKSFEVLVCLLRNAGSLVSKDEIIASVWPGVVASDESLSRCISDVRAALGDGERQIIRTVPGRGYQFASGVASSSVSDARAAMIGQADKPTPRRWRAMALLALIVGGIVAALWAGTPRDDAARDSVRASIAVLPFRNTSEDSRYETFVAGLASDLNSALARVPEMLVISESTTRQYRAQSHDLREIAARLGVDHVLTGTVQGDGDRVRVSVWLSDGSTGSAVWSQRYDRHIAEFLVLQDDIVREVLVGLQIELTHGETARMLSRGTDNLEAWLLNVEAIAEGFKFLREKNLVARDLFRRASELDPDWAPPVSGLAWTYREALRRGWSSDMEADRARWLELAQRCVEIDPGFPYCYIQLGNYLIENGQIEEGIALREKALQLAPSDLSALSGLAWQLVLVGQVKRGLELLERAKRVSPIHPAWLIATEAYAYQVDGQYGKAIEGFRYALANGDFPDWHARLAAVYAQAGDLEKAREQANLFIERRPDGKVADLTRIFKIQDPKITQQYAELLKKAGIPE